MRVPAPAACLLLVFSSSVLRAQPPSASPTGRVTDPSHALISDAKIAAINTATNFRYETSTNNSGEYYLTNLSPGFFDFEAIGAGRKIRQVVLAGVVRRGFVAEICCGVDGGDFRVGDEGVGGIGTAAGGRSAGGLGAKNRGGENE